MGQCARRGCARIVRGWLLASAVVLCPAAARAGCVGLEDSDYIAAAVEYYVLHGQSHGSVAYLDGGVTVETQYLLFVDLADFMAINPECCRVLGLCDSEGPLYRAWETWYYDLQTTVCIRPKLRQREGQDVVVVAGSPLRIPLATCAEVVTKVMR